MGTAPPADTRFRPGQSGNPKGRPRKAASAMPPVSEIGLLSAALEFSKLPMTITESGERKEVTMAQALVRNMGKLAFAGSAYANYRLNEMIEAAQTREALELQQRRALWLEYKIACAQEDELARLRGAKPPKHLPHPDDVVIEPGDPVRFIGPLDESDQRRLDDAIRHRDMLILQNAFDQRYGPGATWRKPYRSSAALHARIIDAMLPPRLRLKEADWINRLFDTDRIKKQEFLKLLYRGWRKLGVNFPRGANFPTQEWGQRAIAADIRCLLIMREYFSPDITADEMFEKPGVEEAVTHLRDVYAALPSALPGMGQFSTTGKHRA